MSSVLLQTMGSANTARRVVRGLTISIGLLAASVAYAAVITPILLKIIGDKRLHSKDDPIDVAWIEEHEADDSNK